MPRVAILCLGDVGRSPRMQYHADAFTRMSSAAPTASTADSSTSATSASEQWHVELCGYEGSPCFPHILSNPNITLHLFPASSSLGRVPSKILRLLLAPIKVLLQIWSLLSLMLWNLDGTPDVILIQNPPAIPTLLVAYLASLYHRSLLLIDWHNFGYTILGLSFGSSSAIVQIAKAYEQYFGALGDRHLCVTEAMKKWLKEEWEIDAQPLHDRAQSHFHRCSATEVHTLFQRLVKSCPELSELQNPQWIGRDVARMREGEWEEHPADEITPFTYSRSGATHFRPDRPTLIISSTSWTADEDFTILADAIVKYDRKIAESREGMEDEQEEVDEAEEKGAKKRGGKMKQSKSSSPSQVPLPRAIYIITGKGPLRDAFVQSLTTKSLRYSSVFTVFLPSADYPLLLGSGDLGVSLHYSSSGLDLPMKVVDMFAAGMPVCAISFQCLSELVRDDASNSANGRIFGGENKSMSPAEELAGQFSELFSDFRVDGEDDATTSSSSSTTPLTQLARFRGGALAWASITWNTCWQSACAPLLSADQLKQVRREKENAVNSVRLKCLACVLVVVGGLMIVL